jgi:hypothetical protein
MGLLSQRWLSERKVFSNGGCINCFHVQLFGKANRLLVVQDVEKLTGVIGMVMMCPDMV